MRFEELINFVPTFLLALFRVAGMVAFAPVLGSAKIPRQVKVLLAVAVTLGLGPAMPQVVLPSSLLKLVAGVGGELVFGIAMGIAANSVFLAAHWGGQLIGQQLGLNLGETFDPHSGGHGSPVQDLYLLFAAVIFLSLNGHLILLRCMGASFQSVPLLSAGVTANLFDLLVGLLQSASMLALQLAAPLLVTMLIVDLALGVISRSVPQLNAMSAGMAVRSTVGIVVILLGAALASKVLGGAMLDCMKVLHSALSRDVMP